MGRFDVMRVIQWISELQLSQVIAGLTAGLAFIATVLASRFLKARYDIVNYLANGLFYYIVQLITKNAAAFLSLRRYCKIQLAGKSR